MTETVRFDTGRFLNMHALEGILKYQKNKYSVYGHLTVELPLSYTSKLSQALEADVEDFASITFRIDNYGIFIDTFQTAVNDPTYRILSSETEMSSSKGLGRIILCKMLFILLAKNIISTETIVKLEALPFLSCNFEKDSALRLKYENYSNEYMLKKLEKFSEVYHRLRNANEIDEVEFRKLLILYLCKLEHVSALVDYYIKLGFKPLVDKENFNFAVPMESNVKTILLQCSLSS